MVIITLVLGAAGLIFFAYDYGRLERKVRELEERLRVVERGEIPDIH